MDELIQFLHDRTRNAWIEIGTYHTYVRRGHHFINDKIINTLDIANIETDEEHRGQGKFKILLYEIQQLLEVNPDLRGEIQGIFVENVVNSRLEKSMPKFGFDLVPRSFPASFFKPLNLGTNHE